MQSQGPLVAGWEIREPLRDPTDQSRLVQTHSRGYAPTPAYATGSTSPGTYSG
jgi:hypothetical protein